MNGVPTSRADQAVEAHFAFLMETIENQLRDVSGETYGIALLVTPLDRVGQVLFAATADRASIARLSRRQIKMLEADAKKSP